ncbi:hypothetical protein VTN02DRAFT_2892 [Thermoascus thermophilus]
MDHIGISFDRSVLHLPGSLGSSSIIVKNPTFPDSNGLVRCATLDTKKQLALNPSIPGIVSLHRAVIPREHTYRLPVQQLSTHDGFTYKACHHFELEIDLDVHLETDDIASSSVGSWMSPAWCCTMPVGDPGKSTSTRGWNILYCSRDEVIFSLSLL